MQCSSRLGAVCGFLFGVSLAALLGLQASAARADDSAKSIMAPEPAAAAKTVAPKTSASKPAATKTAAVKPTAVKPVAHASRTAAKKTFPRSIPHHYFVEFRARNAASYGHMYVMYGTVNGRDEITSSHIAGFFPAGDTRDCANCSVFNWTIGHLIFVPSELGASDGDLEEKYVLARYRVWVTKAEYDKVVAYIKDKEAHKPMWNALWKNCVDFGRDVAEKMDLKVPFFIWMEPKDFITAMREANGVMVEQKPLKDASNGMRAPVQSAARTPPLPPQKPAATEQAKPQQPTAASKPAHPKPKKQPVANETSNKSPEQAMAWSEAH